jgi:integrase
MTVEVRPWPRGKKEGWEVDIRFTYPDGFKFRERRKAKVTSKSAAVRWGQAREVELLMRPSPGLAEQQQGKEVPTLNEFGPRFIDNYAKANRQKASGVHSKEQILRKHLYPRFGDKRLDGIDDEHVQALKAALTHRSKKTVNNVLTVLSKLLKIAVKWKVIKALPCTIELLKLDDPKPQFYEFDQYKRLVDAAAQVDHRALLVVLLGGDAGLRMGEMIALRQTDVDFRRGHIVVEQATWRRVVDSPKSGRGRIVPLTKALAAALQRARHLRGERVFYRDDGTEVTHSTLRSWLIASQKRAGLEQTNGALHILRHTFCSHLAMRGAPAKAIQELAGHTDLKTTLRYMHLSPSAREGAIRLLDQRDEQGPFGEIVETSVSTTQKARISA